MGWDGWEWDLGAEWVRQCGLAPGHRRVNNDFPLSSRLRRCRGPSAPWRFFFNTRSEFEQEGRSRQGEGEARCYGVKLNGLLSKSIFLKKSMSCNSKNPF